VAKPNGTVKRKIILKSAGCGLIAELDTSPAGLGSQEAERRLGLYGPNDVTADQRRPAWVRFFRRFRNPLVMILLVASAISAATGDVASLVIVVAIVVLSGVTDFFQELRAQNAVEALRKQVAISAQAIRTARK
jgi:P-type Mg2+ transporter